MLHLYKDPITGKVYQEYDDEPENNNDDLQKEESEEHDYDSEERKANQEFVRKHNLFKKREIEKSTKHLNNEMDEATEEFYQTKKDKEKDDGLSL